MSEGARVTYATLAACAFAQGLIVYPSAGCATGTEGDVVMLAPPLMVTDDELDEMVAILDGAIETAFH